MDIGHDRHHAWIEVDLDVLEANTRNMAGIVGPDVRIMAVVKGDGYGHGAAGCAEAFLRAGAWGIGVCHLEEGIGLRQAGISSPILVFDPATVGALEATVRYRLASTVVDSDTAMALAEQASASGWRAPVHVAVETGLGRYGIEPGELAGLVASLHGVPGLYLEGIYTHLATDSPRLCLDRLDLFMEATVQIRQMGIPLPLLHAAGSGPAISVPDSRLDMVRLGTSLYGLLPCRGQIEGLESAWAMWSRVSTVRTVPRGESIGYAGDYRATRDRVVAVVPIGFADGIRVDIQRPVGSLRVFVREALRGVYHAFRTWRNPPTVTVHGREAPVVGRVGMQHLVADVTSIEGVSPGDRVGLRCREVVASPLIPRAYVRGGDVVSVRTLAETGGAVERA